MRLAGTSLVARTAPALGIGLALTLSAGAASAQGVLTGSDQQARAEAYFNLGGPPVGNLGLTQDFSGADFWGVEDRSFTGGGFSGRGYADHGATFTPTSPLIGGSFSKVVMDACTSAEIFQSNIGPHASETAYALARGVIEFTLTTTVNWTWTGGWQGASQNTGAFNHVYAEMSLVDVNLGTQHVAQSMTSLNGAGNWSQNFAHAGTLGPGDYRIIWLHESIITGGNTPFGFFPSAVGGLPLISCINSTFEMVPAPSTGAVLALAGLLGARRRR